MTIKSIPISARYNQEKRRVTFLFVGSCIVPLAITILLASSFYFAETRVFFQSIPFIGLILLFYYTLSRKLFFPPLFSGSVLRHKNVFVSLWVTLLLLSTADIILEYGLSLYAVKAFQTLVPGITQITLSNIVYFTGLFIGLLKLALTKKVKVDIPWFSRSISAWLARNWGFVLNVESLRKGLPLLIRNETGKVITITNIRLETFKDPPLIVPLKFLRRILFGPFRSPIKRDVNIDNGVVLPRIIKEKDVELIHIPWENFQEAYDVLVKDMDWKNLNCPSVFAVFDEYLLESWISDPVYVPHLVTFPLLANENVREAVKARFEQIKKWLEARGFTKDENID
jgi:hypothetical protein